MWRQWYTRYLYVLLLTAIEAYWSEQLRVTCAMLQRRVETAAERLEYGIIAEGS